MIHLCRVILWWRAQPRYEFHGSTYTYRPTQPLQDRKTP